MSDTNTTPTNLLDLLAQSPFVPTSSENATPAEKKKSEYWVSVGYESNGRFIALPKCGIPLDNQQPDKVSNPDSEFGQILLAQNFLLEELKKLALTLAPGEARIIDSLQVQMRRIKGDSPAVPTDMNQSKYIKKIF